MPVPSVDTRSRIGDVVRYPASSFYDAVDEAVVTIVGI